MTIRWREAKRGKHREKNGDLEGQTGIKIELLKKNAGLSPTNYPISRAEQAFVY